MFSLCFCFYSLKKSTYLNYLTFLAQVHPTQAVYTALCEVVYITTDHSIIDQNFNILGVGGQGHPSD